MAPEVTLVGELMKHDETFWGSRWQGLTPSVKGVSCPLNSIRTDIKKDQRGTADLMLMHVPATFSIMSTVFRQ